MSVNKKIEKYIFLPTGRNDIFKIDDNNLDDFIDSVTNFFRYGEKYLDYKLNEKTRIFEPNSRMNPLEFKECNESEVGNLHVWFHRKYQNMHGGALFIELNGFTETHFSFLQSRNTPSETNKGLYLLNMSKRKPWDNRDEKIYIRI